MIAFVILRDATCDASVTAEWLSQQLAPDLEGQLTRDLASAWGLDARGITVDPAVRISLAACPAGAYVLEFIGAMPPEDAGAAAYHVEDADGRIRAPIATVYADAPVPLDGVSQAASHEAIEAIGDPGINAWVDRPDGSEEMRELCDRVQDQGYRVRVGGVLLSDFLLPAAFDDDAPPTAPRDFLGAITSRMGRTPGGYVILRRDGVVSQDPPEAKMGTRMRAVKRGHAPKPPADAGAEGGR